MPVPVLRRVSFFPDRGARVRGPRPPRQLPSRQHRHEFLEVVIILSGEGVHTTGRVRHPSQAGDVLVIPRSRSHGFERTRGLNLVNILIREDTLPRLARDLRQLPGYHALFAVESERWRQKTYASRLHLNPSELSLVSEWADRLEEESRHVGEGGDVLAEAYLVLILGLLARRQGSPVRSASRPASGIGRLLSWIEAHLHEPLSVPMLAARVGMSVRSLHRHFESAMGVTPFDYVLGQRIALAKEMLAEDPAARIGEVAARCGFDDSNYFSRVFRSRAGVAPREFAASRAVNPGPAGDERAAGTGRKKEPAPRTKGMRRSRTGRRHDSRSGR